MKNKYVFKIETSYLSSGSFFATGVLKLVKYSLKRLMSASTTASSSFPFNPQASTLICMYHRLMREAAAADVEALEEMENTIFPDNSMNARTLLNEMNFSKCLVEERDGRLVGYLLARVEHDVVDILRVGVLPTWQRRGIAKGLLVTALGMAKKATLLVRKGNDPAIKLYIELGFKIVGHLPHENSWLMLRS